MQVTYRTHRNVDVIDLSGRFTFGERKEFMAAIDKLKQKGAPHIVVNFRQVTFIDSAAIGLLALASQQLKAENRRFSVSGAQGVVLQVLKLARVDQMLTMGADDDAVLNARAA